MSIKLYDFFHKALRCFMWGVFLRSFIIFAAIVNLLNSCFQFCFLNCCWHVNKDTLNFICWTIISNFAEFFFAGPIAYLLTSPHFPCLEIFFYFLSKSHTFFSFSSFPPPPLLFKAFASISCVMLNCGHNSYLLALVLLLMGMFQKEVTTPHRW